jgi:hypothetical protein
VTSNHSHARKTRFLVKLGIDLAVFRHYHRRPTRTPTKPRPGPPTKPPTRPQEQQDLFAGVGDCCQEAHTNVPSMFCSNRHCHRRPTSTPTKQYSYVSYIDICTHRGARAPRRTRSWSYSANLFCMHDSSFCFGNWELEGWKFTVVVLIVNVFYAHSEFAPQRSRSSEGYISVT